MAEMERQPFKFLRSVFSGGVFSSSIAPPSTAPSAPVLPVDLFLLLSTYLDTKTLSRLSRTCHSLHELLALNLKRHHIFRLVGSYLNRTERRRKNPIWDLRYYSVLPRTACAPSIFRLARTCRTLHHALAPWVRRFRIRYAVVLVRIWVRSNRHVELQRCLTHIGQSSSTQLHRCGDSAVDYAVRMGYPEVVRVLLDYGFSTGDTPPGNQDYGRTPLSVAVQRNYLGIARMLLERGARGGRPDWFRWYSRSGISADMKCLLREYKTLDTVFDEEVKDSTLA